MYYDVWNFPPILPPSIKKLDLEVLYFGLFSELSILEWFSTWCFKHARIPIHLYFQRNIYPLYCLSNHDLILILIWICVDMNP